MKKNKITIKSYKWTDEGFLAELSTPSLLKKKHLRLTDLTFHLEDSTLSEPKADQEYRIEGSNLLLYYRFFQPYLKEEEKYRLRFHLRCKRIRDTSWDLVFRLDDQEEAGISAYDKRALYKQIYYDGDRAVIPYGTPGRHKLTFLITSAGQAAAEMLKARMTDVYMRGSRLHVKMELASGAFKPEKVLMRLRNPVEPQEAFFETKIEDDHKGSVKIHGVLDYKKVDFKQFYWDILLQGMQDGHIMEIPIWREDNDLHRRMYFRHLQYKFRNGYVAFVYETIGHNYAVQYRLQSPYDHFWFILKEYIALIIYKAFKKWWDKRNIWLVYEKYSRTAQDNSYFFFDYCMNHLPASEKKRMFYVIDKHSPDFRFVAQYRKKVIPFLSLKHMIYLQAASLLISSDTKAHAYAWHSPNSVYRNSVRAKQNVFLQHGVIYFKQCHKGLRKTGANPCGLFIVSSDVEKKIIKDYFGYKGREIGVTGLARWDALENHADPDGREIFLMPTWRKWLEEVTSDSFRDSDYYKTYTQLLNSSRLKEVLEKYDANLSLYLHPKFQEYADTFHVESPYVHLVDFSLTPMRDLLMRCNMMITDYSSACWDVFYQEKPVVFFTFDWDMYQELEGSYIDMHRDAFGDCADSPEQLIDLIEYYCKNHFQEKEIYKNMRDQLLPYRDHNNSERIYQAICRRYPDLAAFKEEIHDS